MTSLKVAVRVRPLSQRESFLGSGVVVDVQGKDILVTDAKVPVNHGCDHRVRVHRFTFDFGFWSVDPATKKYASQEMVYEEFGRVVLNTVLEGYNSCVIAYGPSGSGKTYTMMGSKEENGLTPRICEGLFTKLTDQTDNQLPFQIDISFMEIYNEQVFDLLQKREIRNNRKPKLRIREHPIHGPFVEGLSTHVVKNIDDVCDLLARGNECRVNAATHVHDRSSRSHAIFTIRYSQACINECQPREVVSKLHLVDLAGSEKAAPEFCQSRVKEGGNINKSLVTLGNVISVLVELSLRSKQGEVNHQQTYVPYRDSHLTWLLKDSLGGNSHTFMLAAISPSKECYIETVSTLRYAQRATFVMNKPVVNKNPGTEMLRNLQTEVRRLHHLLMTAEKLNNKFVIKPLPDIIQLRKIMEDSSRTVDLMTKQWFDKWMKTYDVVLNRVTKKKGSIPGKYITGSEDDTFCNSEKNTSSTKVGSREKLASKIESDAVLLNSSQENFKDSSECLILCKDTVGFAKKRLGHIDEHKCLNANVNNAISKETKLDFSDIKSSSENMKPKTASEKKYISSSDNILFQHSYISPYFRFLSLDGMNVTYPYCNYSWITQNKVLSMDPMMNETTQTSGNLKTSETSSISDQFNLNSDCIELNSDSIELNSDSIELNSDSIELNSDSIELNSDSIELNSDPKKLLSDSIELNSDYIELNSDPKELLYDSIELNSGPIELLSDSTELNSYPTELLSESVKLNIDSVKSNIDSVKSNIDTVKSNIDSVMSSIDSVKSNINSIELLSESIELKSNSTKFLSHPVQFKHTQNILDKISLKEHENYAAEQRNSTNQHDFICSEYQDEHRTVLDAKNKKINSFIPGTECENEYNVVVSIPDIQESSEIKNPDKRNESDKTCCTKDSSIGHFSYNPTVLIESHNGIRISSAENMQDDILVEEYKRNENKISHCLRRNDIKFSERVNEESRHFLDLLSHLNHDTTDHCPGMQSPRRKDSEVMSLLSFSSLDCPVWKSLDDFLGSSEETVSNQDDDQLESSQRVTLGIRRYSNRKASCSSIDSNIYPGYVPTNIVKDASYKEENEENCEFKRRNSKIFKQVIFNNFPKRIINNTPLITDDVSSENILNETLEPSVEYTFNKLESIRNVNEEQQHVSQLPNNNEKDIFSNISVNFKNKDNENSSNIFKNDASILEIHRQCSKITLSDKDHAILTPNHTEANSAKNEDSQLNGENIRENNVLRTSDCESDISEIKPSGLKLTKANLDLLEQKLKDCREINENYFKTCFAYALDVNSAKGILGPSVEANDSSENESEAILLNSNERNGEIDKIMPKITENELNTTFESQKDPQNTEFERELKYEQRNTLATEIPALSESCLESSLSDIVEENDEQNRNNIITSDKNGIADMWQNNFFAKEAVSKEENENNLDNSSVRNDFESSQFPWGIDLKPIVEDEKDSEIMEKGSKLLLNNTFTSDSLDNYEQEMVKWANKYLTRNNSNSSQNLAPEKNSLPQTVDANELGLDEFEFCAELNESGENDSIHNSRTFDNADIMASETLENNGLRNTSISSPSRSSSSDSITYVFLGTDDKDNPNRNVSANMSQYSSVPSSVSLDSLERSAYRPKFSCLSPRTLSIDSLVAEELLAQLRSGELGSISKNENSFQTQEHFQLPKRQFTEFVPKDINKSITKEYQANITETFSPENNCSFDALNSDHNNREKQNTETKFCLTDHQEKAIDEARKEAFESTCKNLQRVPLGASKYLVNKPRHTSPTVKKSATNSEIYKFCETNDLKLTVKKRLVASSQSSSTSQERLEVERGRNINFEQLARNYNSKVHSSSTTNENIMDSFLVPPPISFITAEKIKSVTKITSYDCGTQTDEPYPSKNFDDGQTNSLPPKTLELILRMMEMMTETIKFLKNEKPQPQQCCGGCSHQCCNLNVRRKLDYFNEPSENFHECTSLSSESNIDIPQKIRPFSNRHRNKHSTPENFDGKKKISTRCCNRQRRRQQESVTDISADKFELSTQQRQHHTIPIDYRGKKLCLKESPKLLETKKYLPSTSTEHSGILPFVQPSLHAHTIYTTHPLKSNINSNVTGNYRNSKSAVYSQVSQNSPKDHLSQLLKMRRGITEKDNSAHLKERSRCYDKRLFDEPCEFLEHPSTSESSSSEGYLSSISSTTTPKQISDTSESVDFIKSISRSTVPKPSTYKARNLKPLILSRCPEDQRTVTPNTSWQNTSADSGAFFMDSPLAENKKFCNWSPETSNLPVPSFLRERQPASEKERNPPSLADGTTNQHFNSRLQESSDISSANNNYCHSPAVSNLTVKQTEFRKLKRQDRLEPYYLKRLDDTEEEYLDIRIKSPLGATAKMSASDSSRKGDCLAKTNSSAEEFALKISDENYNITRTDIERILASIEADKQFLRRHRNPIFERQYSPEIRARSPFGKQEDERFLSDSYKSLPKSVLYLSLAKDPSLVS